MSWRRESEKVICKTFIFNDASNRDAGYRLLSEWSGRLPNDYVEGFVELKVNDTVLLCERHWDIVDDFWIYFSQCLKKYAMSPKRQAEFLFPDQPLRFAMEHVPFGLIRVTVGDTSAVVDEGAFLQAVAQEAIRAIRRFQQLCHRVDEREFVREIQESMATLEYSQLLQGLD